MPGSLAFLSVARRWLHLAADLVQKLVQLALDAHAEKRRNLYDYQTNLVDFASQRGIKGSKGANSLTSWPGRLRLASKRAML